MRPTMRKTFDVASESVLVILQHGRFEIINETDNANYLRKISFN